MNFKTAIEHYRAGTATNDERAWVEEELEKYQLLSDLMDAQWEQTPAAPEASPDADLKKLRRSLRRRSVALVCTTLALVVVILAAAAGPVSAFITRQVADRIARNEEILPEDQYPTPEVYTYDEYASDLYYAFDAYCELFIPGCTAWDLSAYKTGFATYELELMCMRNGRTKLFYPKLEKGRLIYTGDFIDAAITADSFVREQDVAEREALLARTYEGDQFETVEAAISFTEDMTMEELLAFQQATGLTIQWAGIRVAPESRQDSPLCGMAPCASVISQDGINGSYPCFCLSSQEINAQDMETHFASLLRYSRDWFETGLGITANGVDADYYGDALEYIEENGIYAYGCVVTGSRAQMRLLLNNEAVSMVTPGNGWD